MVHDGPMYVPFFHLPLSFLFTGCESKALFEVNPAASPLPPVDSPYWVGVAPLAAYSAATTPDVSANATN
jgi:hypothetical protein